MSEARLPHKQMDIVKIFPEIDSIADARLRQAVIDVWDELWEMSDWESLEDLPTSSEIVYPHVRHNQCVVALALGIADCYERFHGVKVNRDYLIAAAVLQDASKVVENLPGSRRSEIGKYLPHSFWGSHLAVQKGVPLEVVHVMLYHTPKASKFPSTLEGKILYYADQLDVLAIYKDRFVKEIIITKEAEKNNVKSAQTGESREA